MNNLDKKKTIKYLQKVVGLHDSQLSPIGDYAVTMLACGDNCPECMEEMSHGFKREFAKMLIAKIELGDLDD